MLVKSDLKLRRYRLHAGKLLTLTESRWRTPRCHRRKSPRDAREKCERRKVKSVSRSTRWPDNERSSSRLRTQSLDILPPANKGRRFVRLSRISHRVIPSCFLVDFSQPFPANGGDVPGEHAIKKKSYALSFVLVKNSRTPWTGTICTRNCRS